MVVLAGLVFFGMLCGAGCSSPTAPDRHTAPVLDAVEIQQSIVYLTNTERARYGIGPLTANPQLNHAAQLHADQLLRAGRLEHVLADAPYPSPQDRLAAAGYVWAAYGENLAFGQPGSAEAINAWLNSPGHRASLLGRDFTEVGVGYAVDRAGRPYYVQVFGHPR